MVWIALYPQMPTTLLYVLLYTRYSVVILIEKIRQSRIIDFYPIIPIIGIIIILLIDKN